MNPRENRSGHWQASLGHESSEQEHEVHQADAPAIWCGDNIPTKIKRSKRSKEKDQKDMHCVPLGPRTSIESILQCMSFLFSA